MAMFGLSNILNINCNSAHKYACNASGNCVQDASGSYTTPDCAGACKTLPTTCVPHCADKSCGDDGCGGSCGTCIGDTICNGFSCVEPECFIDSFSISPEFHTIVLNSSFKAEWSTNNCLNCNLSCSGDGCGKDFPKNNIGITGNNYVITPTKAGSNYTYTLYCWRSPANNDTKTLGGGVGTDRIFRVINPFWRETPAFLKLLVDKMFQEI